MMRLSTQRVIASGTRTSKPVMKYLRMNSVFSWPQGLALCSLQQALHWRRVWRVRSLSLRLWLLWWLALWYPPRQHQPLQPAHYRYENP